MTESPWAPTQRFFEGLEKLRAEDPNPKLYRFKDTALDEDGWPKRWSNPTYLGDGPDGA